MASFLDELAKTVKKAAEAQKAQTNNAPAKNVWSESLAPKSIGGSSKSSGSGSSSSGSSSSGGGTSTKKQNNSFYEDYQARKKQQQSRARFTPSTLLGAQTKKSNSSFYDDYQARKKQQQSGRFTPSLLNTGSSARRFTPSVRRQPNAQDWSESLSPVRMRDMLSAETSAATQRRKAAVKQDILNNSKYRFTDLEIDSVINSQNPREDMTALVKRKGGSDTEARNYGEYVYYNLLDDTHKKQYNKDMDATERQGLGAQYTTDIETQKARTETSNRRLDKLEKEIEEKAKKAVQQLQNQVQTGDRLRDATLKDLTVNSFKQGYYNTRYGEEMYKAMGGMANNSAAYRAKLADNDYLFEPGNWFEKAVSGMSGQIGQMVRNATNPTTAATMAAAGGAAAIAGNAGPQSLIPEEVITVPAALSAAYMAGSAANIMKVEAGLAYDEMTQNGISPETASKIALGVGVANSALEAVQLDDLIKSFKILGRSGATGNVAVEIGKALLRRGVDVTKETAEEVAQEGVTIAGSQLANKLDKGEWAYNADEVKNRLKDTAISSALTFGALGAAGDISGTAIGAYDNYKDTANTGRNIRDAGKVQDVIDEGKAQGTGTKAYRQAQNMNADTASNFRVGRQANLNAEAMTDEARLARLINERTGYDVNYRLDMPSWNAGEIRGNDININANKGQRVDTVLHEVGHIDTPEAQAAADKTIEVLQKKPEYKAQLDARLNTLKQFYDRQGVEYTEQMLLNEIAVDMRRGGLLYRTSADYDRATRTDNYDRDRFIPNTVRRATSTVKSVFGGTVTNENAGITVSAKDANTIREAWERADNASAGAHRTGTATETGDVKYDVKTDADGNPYVIIDADILDGVPEKEWARKVKNVLRDKFKEGIDYNGENIAVSGKSRGEFTYSEYSQNMNKSDRADKFRMANNLDEIINTQDNVNAEPPKQPREDDIVGFERGKSRVVVGKHEFIADVLLANKKDGTKQFYDLLELSKTKIQHTANMSRNNANIMDRGDVVSSTDSITNPDENVKTKFSVDTNVEDNGIDDVKFSVDTSSDTSSREEEYGPYNGFSLKSIKEQMRIGQTMTYKGRKYDNLNDLLERVARDHYWPDTYMKIGYYYDDFDVDTLKEKEYYRVGEPRIDVYGPQYYDSYNFADDRPEYGVSVITSDWLNSLKSTFYGLGDDKLKYRGIYKIKGIELPNTGGDGEPMIVPTGWAQRTPIQTRAELEKAVKQLEQQYADVQYSVDTNTESEDAPPVPNEEDWENLMTGSEAENQAQRQSAENRTEAERRTQIFMEQQGVTSPRELAPDTVTRRQSEKERSLWKSSSPVRKAMGKAYTAVVDDMHPFWNYNKAYERASKTTTYGKDNPYKLSINAKDASSRAAYIVTDEMVDFDNNSIGKGLVDTITDSGITKDTYDEFNKYLVARHALEWLDPDGHGAVKNVYDDPRLNDMGVVQMMAEDFENAHPEFKQAADNLYEWQRKLIKTWLVDTGVITQEQYDTFTQMYPDYVPFFREQDTTLGRGKVGMANQGEVIKEAVGSESRRILEPIENIMYNVASYVNHGTKHEVIKTAVQQYDMLDSDPENNVLRQYWEEVVPVNPEQEQNLYFRPKRGDDPSVDDATNEGERSISSTLRQQSDVRNGVVSFLDDGKMRYFRVYDKDFLNVLDNVRKGRDGILAMFAAFSRTRAALITSFNPAFSLASNPVRDFGTLITNSTDANKAKIVAGAVSSYYDIAKKSDAYKNYLAMGGQYSSVNTEGMTAMKQALQKLQATDPNLAKRFFKLFPKGFGVYQTVSDAIEAAPRMAEFKSTLEQGYDYHEAFYRAKDVTTNFSRGGQIAKELNAVSNFFNASIQGVDKYFRQAKNNPKSFAIGIACLTVPALLAWAWNHLGDDKDKKEAYDNLSNYHKNNSYNFYIGGGKFVSIPKARESAVITSSIEMALDKFLAGESDRDKDFFADYMLSQFLPDGSIIGLSTISDLRANKDYMDRPIVSDELSELPAELQYDDSTSYLAKWLGGALKVSPKQIDHVINSETGVLGKINRTYFTPSAKDDKAAMYSFGVLDTYVKDSLFSTDNLNMFYDNKEKADKQANGYPSADTTYLSNKYTQASGVLSVLNKMYKENSQSDEGREIRKQYVRFARNNKDNPTGLSDEVYNEIKGLYDTDSGVLSLPKVDRTIKSDGASYTFDDAQSVVNYKNDLNEAVDRAYRKIMRGTDYAAMNEDEKVDALSKAKSDAVKEVKKFYVENEGQKRMSFGKENVGKVEKPTQAETEAAQQKRAYRENIENTYMKQAADNFSKVNPDKDGYDVDTMKINDVSSVEIDGTKYSLSGDTKTKVTEAANEKYYTDLERYMSGEANIEDIIGYSSNGKALYSNDNNNKRVYLTGKRFNDDGSERFDETISAKIIFRIKDAATEAATQEYKDEITGAAAATETPTETSAAVSDVKTVSRANTSRGGGSSRSTSRSGGSSSSGGTSRVKFTPSGGSSGGASQGGTAARLKFTPSGTTSGAAQFTPTASVASAQRFIPSTRETQRQMRFIPRTENAVKPKEIKAIQPMQMI